MAYKIATVSKIPIYVDWSLVILLLLMVSNYGNPLLGLLIGVGVALSIALHELGHSLVAQAFGCQVRDITLMMLGGCATMLDMPRKAWQEFLMAAAGPLVSLLLGFAGLWSAMVLKIDPLGYVTAQGQYEGGLFFWLGAINVGLFIFNLLPAFPMDGGRILRAFLQQFFMSRLRATWVASRIGRLLAFLMGLSVILSLLSPTGDGFGGFKLIRLLIAFYIYRAADNEYRMVLRETMGAEEAGGFSFFGRRNAHEAPPDDGKAVISPPPYERSGKVRVDIHKE